MMGPNDGVIAFPDGKAILPRERTRCIHVRAIGLLRYRNAIQRPPGFWSDNPIRGKAMNALKGADGGLRFWSIDAV